MKYYVFTELEILVLRDALIEHYQNTKHLKPISPIAIEMKKATMALKEQFKSDCN
jgi:hypothetical protein